MVVEAYCDRQIPAVVENLLAYQRDAPIHIRLVSQSVHDFRLPDGRLFSEKLKQLVTFKDAKITMLVNPDKMQAENDRELLAEFENMGVKVHLKKGLHAKLVLLDSRKDKAALIMSANLTPTSLWKRKEIAVYILNELEHVHAKLYNYTTNLLKEKPP